MEVVRQKRCIEHGFSKSFPYGRVVIGGRTQGMNRWAWEKFYGPIPAGLFVCHRCDNPSCINPDHLFLGTPKDNTHDAVRKGRIRNQYQDATHCKHGHEFTPENTYRFRKMRQCKACHLRVSRESHRRKIQGGVN